MLDACTSYANRNETALEKAIFTGQNPVPYVGYEQELSAEETLLLSTLNPSQYVSVRSFLIVK